MAALRPRQRPYTPSRPPDEPVIVDVEHRLGALDAARLTVAGPSDTWTDQAAVRPAVEGLWSAEIPAEWIEPGGRVWHVTSLGEREAAGVALGDGPAGPEMIPGAARRPPASRLRRRKPAGPHWSGVDSSAWPEEAISALSDSPSSTAHSRLGAGLRSYVSRWWWLFYLLLCGPFLALGRVLVFGRTAMPRTLLILAAVIGILVTVAASAELLRGSRTEVPTQAQPTAQVAEAQPPSEAVSTQVVSAVPVGARVVVANTDGQGLYLRRQPDWVSKWVAWGEGTGLHVLAAGVNGPGAPGASGAAWLQVRDPEGRVGYVPEQYVTLTPGPNS